MKEIINIVHTYARPSETDDYGGSGATKPFEYFLENGVSSERLVILEKGVEAFAKEYLEYLVTQ